MGIGRCKSCHRQIDWVVTKNGKRMPIDPHPSEDGNVVVLPGLEERCEVFRTPSEARWWLLNHEGRGPFVVHFESCPSADEHRKAA